MSKKFWKPCIDDVQNNGCNEAEADELMNVFEYVMRLIGGTLVRKAEFCLSDFELSKERVGHFTLAMTRTENREVDQWRGTFEAEGKSLKILGMLERY